MLHPHKSAMSTAVILDVIRELTDDTNYVVLDGIVSAKIRGNLEIDSEPIKVHLTNSRPNYALIDVMWEDCGYKNYKHMGLFGRMSTQWQEVERIAPKTFRVVSDTYQLEIQY